jgi:hypothetical protein
MWDMELTQLSNSGSIMAVFNQNKVREFYQNNAIRISSTKEKQEALMREYIAVDEDGSPKTEGEGKERKLVLKEPIREHEYQEKRNEFLNEIVAVEI